MKGFSGLQLQFFKVELTITIVYSSMYNYSTDATLPLMYKNTQTKTYFVSFFILLQCILYSTRSLSHQIS